MELAFDQLITADRMLTVQRVYDYLGEVEAVAHQMSEDEITEMISRLDDLRMQVDKFLHLDDDGAFQLTVAIRRLITGLRRYHMQQVARRPNRRDVYVKGNSTLWFLAEDELASPTHWPRFLAINGIRYSTDLLSRQTVSVPNE